MVQNIKQLYGVQLIDYGCMDHYIAVFEKEEDARLLDKHKDLLENEDNGLDDVCFKLEIQYLATIDLYSRTDKHTYYQGIPLQVFNAWKEADA
ncbi:hypothetical protein ACI2KR_31695 [Pseudomonas luteola]